MISEGMKISDKSRRISLILKTLSIGLILCFCLGLAAPLHPKTITLIHTNDIHGIIKPYKLKLKDGERLVGGMEALSHYINELRAQEKNMILIDLGDLMTGTLASEVDYKGVQGGAMIEFLNRLEYDVFGLGNHEFDLGQDNALKLVKLARFPSIIANIIYQKNGDIVHAEYKGAKGKKALFSLVFDDVGGERDLKFLVEPEVVPEENVSFIYGYDDFRKKVEGRFTQYIKYRKYRPAEELDLYVNPNFLRDITGYSIGPEEFDVLCAVLDNSRVEHIYRNSFLYFSVGKS